MGARGPVRNPNSRRGQAEVRKRQQLAASSVDAIKHVAPIASVSPELPTCDRCLPRRVQEIYQNLVIDLAASGVPLKQIDSHPITQAARKLHIIEEAERIYSDGDVDPSARTAAMSNADRADRALIQWYKLACIGPGERARIGLKAPPEKKGGALANMIARRQARLGS